MSSEERLKPARPESHGKEKPSYMPRMPWMWVGVGSALLLFVVGFIWIREKRDADAVRAGIVQAYDTQMGPMVRRYRGFRSKIEGWVMEAALAEEPREFADERLRIASLHSGEGVYLRLNAEQATNVESIQEGALAMRSDAIGRCLGITPISLRGFYEGGEFLMPAWIDDVREEDSARRLKILDDDLRSRVERNVPNLSHTMQAQYFLLVLERGPNRMDHPVDVYMWDLSQDRLLLSLRTQPSGLLIPARIRLPGVKEAPYVRPRGHRMLASDCSIAAAVKELTGEPALTFGSDMPDLSGRDQAEETIEGETTEGETTEGEATEGETTEGETAEGSAPEPATPPTES